MAKQIVCVQGRQEEAHRPDGERSGLRHQRQLHRKFHLWATNDHAPDGDAEVRTGGCWELWKNIAAQDPSFGHPDKFCDDTSEETNWESATITTAG